MKLTEWQKSTETTNTELAKTVGVHPSFFTHINNNRRRPSPELALKIQEATGGQVTVIELLYPNNDH